jgi:hypothetical protein
MKSMYVAFAILISASQPAFSQMLEYGFPLEAPSDPRSVAMGESFVALASNPAAVSCNPAGLAGLKGMSVSYAQRNLDWTEDGWSINSFNAAVPTRFGVFALQYNRKFLGKDVFYQYSPGSSGPSTTFSAQDFAVGYALSLPLGISLGVSGKYYDFWQSATDPVQVRILSITPVVVFDLGANFTFPALHDRGVFEDSVTFGASFQNIGSRWRVPSYSAALLIPDWYWQANGLPQFFRLGVSYGMTIMTWQKTDLTPFAALFSAEYRSLRTSHEPFTGTSYWGVGLECTVYDIVSLRGGMSIKPYSDFEGDKDRASFRYGAAVHLPVHKMGVGLPLTFSFSYTVVPLRAVKATMPIFLPLTEGKDGTALPAYAFEIHYEGFPW